MQTHTKSPAFHKHDSGLEKEPEKEAHAQNEHKASDEKQSSRGRFAGKSLEDLLIIEICGGSARLTKTVREAGFKGMAVDHKRERSCGIDICLFDLTDPSQLEALWQFIVNEAEHIAFDWIAPPCGTASRAREKPIPPFKAMGLPVPQPLRHINQPDQADGLGHLDKTKVELANQLYEAISTMIEICCKYQIPVAVENPHNSHYWNTSPMERVKRLFGTNLVNFHNCAHGGDRDKLTSLWVNNDILSSLTLFCDGQHRHARWKPNIVDNKPRFPTFGLKKAGNCSGLRLCGRTYDLKSAYKQFAVGVEDRGLLRVGTSVPGESKPRLLGFNVLPFGAVGSVAGFLRVSVAVWYIGFASLGLLWICFFDDSQWSAGMN